MSFEFKMARRYFAARRKSLARFTALVAVVGIAAGVASLILAQSLANGFSDEMRDKILANTAHIAVSTADGAEIGDWRTIENRLKKIENVAAISETTLANSLIITADATSYAVLKVRASPKSAQVQSRVELAVGKELAAKLNLQIGDEAEIVILENADAPQRTKIVVKEIFQTGLYEYDAGWIQIAPADFARLNGQTNFTPQILNVSVRDIYQTDETARLIRENLGANFKVLDWQEANRPLFAALSLEKKVALAIISLIIFVAALNITTTLALLVNERKLDIAVLRTCGARAKSLILVFLLEGLFLAFVGMSAGVALGLSCCLLGNYFQIIRLSADVYSLSYIPFHPNLFNVIMIIFITFLLCLTATVYPAFKASRIKPLENLRQQ